jgi:enterochelin esterase-like enzyme
MFRPLLVVPLAMLTASWARGQTAPPSGCTATGDLEIRELRSTVFHNTRQLRILLPPGYRDGKNSKAHYPVLYLNDGQNLFDVCTAEFGPREWQVDETVTRLTAEGKIEPLIVVGIDNPGKHERPNEYLPFPDPTLKPYRAVVHGTDYPRFLTHEVMPFVETHYRVRKGPENTGLGGSSYGGLITFYTMLQTDHAFGRVLIESPSLDVAHDSVFKTAPNQHRWPSRIYFGGGTDEDPPGAWNSIPADIDRAVQFLKARGVSAHDIFVNITPGHHDELAWAARLPAALEFLFPAQ